MRFLIQAYPIIRTKLIELNRLEWLDDDFNTLCQPALYEVQENTLWQRVSGHQHLRGNKLAIVQQLAIWREQQAKKHNRPRKWIMSDDLLMALAKLCPSSPAELNNVRGIPPRLIEQHQSTLLEILANAAKLPQDEWPTVKTTRTTTEQDALCDAVMALLRLRATENKISLAALATRKEIEKIIMGDRDKLLLHGWRAELAGNAILALLKGELTLQVKDGKLIAQKSN